MSDILCVTNRKLCKDDFPGRIQQIARAQPAAVLLREKDLTENDYLELAGSVMEICRRNHTLCILHSFVNAARRLDSRALHLPLPLLRTLSAEERQRFTVLGASCHSPEEALEAEALGCTYIIAGHIFETNCKQGLPGRGLTFLLKLCKSVSLPVWAIGGICPETIAEVRTAGAAGACVMSSVMECGNVRQYLRQLQDIWELPPL